MVPGLNSNGEYFVSRDFKDFANSEGFVIIAPSFAYDKENFKSQQSYQYPSVWSGDALLEIIEQFEENNGIITSDLYLFGFSAGAQFSLRFCLWQPWLCVACAAHGSGGYVIPDTYVDARFFVTVGERDTDRLDQANTFYSYATDLGIDVTYRKYNVGHGLSYDQIEDSIEFFESIEQ